LLKKAGEQKGEGKRASNKVRWRNTKREKLGHEKNSVKT